MNLAALFAAGHFVPVRHRGDAPDTRSTRTGGQPGIHRTRGAVYGNRNRSRTQQPKSRQSLEARSGGGMERAQHVEATTQPMARTFGPGRSVTGLEFERYFATGRRGSVRRDRVGAALGRHRQRTRRARVRAARRRVSEVLVAAGHQHRRLQVFPRADRHAGARALASSSSSAASSTRSRAGRASRSISRPKTTCRRSATT